MIQLQNQNENFFKLPALTATSNVTDSQQTSPQSVVGALTPSTSSSPTSSTIDELKSSDNKSNGQQFNFGKCRVCKDKATGVHYGIPSCEGCKGFFKRSIEKNERYVCYFGYKCVITPKQRKRCKYCRWVACLKAGMSFDGIKMGRIPKIEKEKAKVHFTDGLSNDDFNNEYDEDDSANNTRIESYKLSLKNLLNLNSSLGLFNEIDPYTLIPKTSFNEMCIKTSNENKIFVLTLIKDKCYQLYRENTIKYREYYDIAMKLIKNGVDLDIYRYSQTLDQVWKAFCLEIANFTKILFKTLTQLPGFDRFDTKDLALIVNNRLFTAYGLCVTRLFINDEDYLMLDDNIHVTRYWLGRVMGINTAERIFDYRSKFNSFNLTDCELGILVPLLICYEDLEISNKELLKELKMYYTQVLIYEFNLNFRKQEFYTELSQLLQMAGPINTMCKEASYPEIQ